MNLDARYINTVVCPCGYEAPPFDWNEWVREGNELICPVCGYCVMVIAKELEK